MDDQKIVIWDNGLTNGSKTYSIFSDSNQPIITDKELEKISKDFVRMYPDWSKKINKHLQDWSDLPKEVNLDHLDGGAKFKLIEQISLEFGKSILK
jgi:hypothetical protein